jgi:hypothetical protein
LICHHQVQVRLPIFRPSPVTGGGVSSLMPQKISAPPREDPCPGLAPCPREEGGVPAAAGNAQAWSCPMAAARGAWGLARRRD